MKTVRSQPQSADRRRRLVILGTLIVTIGVVLGIRAIRNRTASVAKADVRIAQADDTQLHAHATKNVAVWPTELARDPFARQVALTPLDPDAAQKEARSKLALGTILLSGNPRAVINGSILREGDEILGYRVHSIERYIVVVEQDGMLIELIP